MQGRHASQNWNGMHYEKKHDLPYFLKTTPLPTCFPVMYYVPGQPNWLAKSNPKEHWPSSTVWMLDCYTTRTASVAPFFLVAPLRIQPRSAKTIRGSGRWLMAASKSTVTLQRWPLSLVVLCLTSYFPCLSVQKSVMHIWNWFETHCAVCWCCMEREVTKEVHQITASDEEPGGLQWKNTLYIIIYIQYTTQST